MSLNDEQQAIKDEFLRVRGTWGDPWERMLELDPAFVRAYLDFSAVPWRREPGALPAKVRELLSIAVDAAATHLYVPGIRQHIAAALDAGATPQEVMEVLELTSTLGIHAANIGVPLLVEVLVEEGLRDGPAPLDARQEQLKAEFTETRGYWHAFWDEILELDPDLFEPYVAFSAVPWRTGTLEPKVKELVYCALDASATHLYVPGLKLHLRNALGHGATRSRYPRDVRDRQRRRHPRRHDRRADPGRARRAHVLTGGPADRPVGPWSSCRRRCGAPDPLTRVAAPLREQATDRIRAAILDLRLRPGQRLVERELVESLGVSRATVREVIRQLAAEGLVTVVPQRGAEVTSLSPSDAADIYEMRASLEALAVRRFVQRADDATVRALRHAVEEIARSVERVHADGDGAVQDHLGAKDRFYEVLMAGSASDPLQQTLAGLQARVRLLRATSLSAPGRPTEAATELRRVVEAVEERDADGRGRGVRPPHPPCGRDGDRPARRPARPGHVGDRSEDVEIGQGGRSGRRSRVAVLTARCRPRAVGGPPRAGRCGS